MLKFLATYYTSITKSHNFFVLLLLLLLLFLVKGKAPGSTQIYFLVLLYLKKKKFIMAVINFFLFLKCSFLILKFSHFLHIHNKVKKSLNLKFSNYLFFLFYYYYYYQAQGSTVFIFVVVVPVVFILFSILLFKGFPYLDSSFYSSKIPLYHLLTSF